MKDLMIWSIINPIFWYIYKEQMRHPLFPLKTSCPSIDRFACLDGHLWKNACLTPVSLWFCLSFCYLVHIQSVIEPFRTVKPCGKPCELHKQWLFPLNIWCPHWPALQIYFCSILIFFLENVICFFSFLTNLILLVVLPVQHPYFCQKSTCIPSVCCVFTKMSLFEELPPGDQYYWHYGKVVTNGNAVEIIGDTKLIS